ncbi:MAG: DUF2804 domain-containing protein [Spirochaetes bacterium]|nr:DUF2804 domain-containing protein [Spirochaetota bacterium]
MQKCISQNGDLLDSKGQLIEKGYSTSLVRRYNPENVSVYTIPFLNKLRIKEWDYYGITTKDYFVSATISHIGYAGLVFVYYIDFKTKEFIEDTLITPLGKGFTLGRTSDDDSYFKKGTITFTFRKKGIDREIYVRWPQFGKGKGFNAHWIMKQTPRDSIVMMTPIGKKRFYYNQKINCMPASGAFMLGGNEFGFNYNQALATLDWGRGVWEYKSFWNWASASWFLPDGTPFGLNLGKGFGDLSYATENCFFINGHIHKLDKVEFNYDNTNFMKPWYFGSNDGRLGLTFTPFFERVAASNLLLIKSEVHQLFGIYSGFVVDSNGKKIDVQNIIGWAEEHHARW